MKKRFLKLDLWLLCLLICSLVACDRKDGEEPEEEAYDRPKIASDEVINYPAAYIGDIPPEMRIALDKRFTNVGSLTPETKVAIIHEASLDAIDDEVIRQVYNNGGIIVVLDPVHSALLPWCEENGFNYAGYALAESDGEAFGEMYAFNDNNVHYSMDPISAEEDHNNFLNSFTSWVNGQFASLPPLNAEPKDVRTLFSSQQLTHTFKFNLHVEEGNYKTLDESGSIDVNMVIYPLYAFADQGSNVGDYYIVSATVTAHNRDVYAGNVTKKHAGVYVRRCGFYMMDMNMKADIVLADDDERVNPIHIPGSTFAAGGSPVPLTSQGATSYTSGFSWSLGASVGGKVNMSGPEVSSTYNGGVTFSNSSTRSISDVNITNNSNPPQTDFTYLFQNLPKYAAKVAITDPPLIAVNNATFYQDWVWRIPEAHDDFNGLAYSIFLTIGGHYGSCHFYTTTIDFRVSSTEIKTNARCFRLTPPNRTPTGMLTLHNSSTEFDNLTATNIRVTKSGTTTTLPGSISPGQTQEYNLPTGTYRIDLQMGPDRQHLTDYFLEGVTIPRGEKTKSINMPFDFTEVKK
jgi:hypothetical protein